MRPYVNFGCLPLSCRERKQHYPDLIFLMSGKFFEWGFMLISGLFLYLVGNGGIYSYGLIGILCKHLC